MCYDQPSPQLPAPCFIESGILVNQDDMRRLLSDLVRVRYQHFLDGKLQNQGEGWILEVFSHPQQATIVSNGTLYLNLHSFDYLQLQQVSPQETHFNLVQDNRQLRLIPMANTAPIQDTLPKIDEATLEAMVAQVLAAKWDVQLDDEDC